ncbi:hypothetical protein B0H11DRAFT_2259703 [Mycena galericulata]|nr:hypothetical protein B0H11DRAFT_2259703 [Mycena galericulata]
MEVGTDARDEPLIVYSATEQRAQLTHYLVAGATREEREHLHLNKMMSRSIQSLSRRHVAQTFQLIATNLHLGNLEFMVHWSWNEDAAVGHNTDACEIVADFLGVHPSDLKQALSYKTKPLKELCTGFRDDFAPKTLYSPFRVSERAHQQHLCKAYSTSRALLPPQLGQFCVNFANERLQPGLKRLRKDLSTNSDAETCVASLEPFLPAL